MAKCGAKTKKGQGPPCTKDAMPNGKCRWHGGASTGPPEGNSNAAKHGFYSKAFTAEEQDGVSDASISDAVDAAYIQHRRLVVYLKDTEGLDENQKQRYQDLIDKALGRIAQLEKTRAELSENNPGDNDEPDESFL